MCIKIKNEGGKMYVESPYSADWIKRAKMLHGKWARPCWVFDADIEDDVKAALMAIYGECGEEVERVDVLITLTGRSYPQSVSFGGIQIASRSERDYPVRLGDQCILVGGSFDESGGSRANPRVTCEEGTAVKIKGCPRSVYEAHKDDDPDKIIATIIDSKQTRLAELLKERDRLLRRVAEINGELQQYEHEMLSKRDHDNMVERNEQYYDSEMIGG